MKSRLLNKRGVAIEAAVAMMLLVFSLCTLMTTYCLVSRSADSKRFDALEQEAEVDMIGEKFVKSNDKENFTTDNENYTAEVTTDGTKYTLTVTDKTGAHKLTVVYDNQNGEIDRWSRIKTD